MSFERGKKTAEERAQELEQKKEEEIARRVAERKKTAAMSSEERKNELQRRRQQLDLMKARREARRAADQPSTTTSSSAVPSTTTTSSSASPASAQPPATSQPQRVKKKVHFEDDEKVSQATAPQDSSQLIMQQIAASLERIKQQRQAGTTSINDIEEQIALANAIKALGPSGSDAAEDLQDALIHFNPAQPALEETPEADIEITVAPEDAEAVAQERERLILTRKDEKEIAEELDQLGSEDEEEQSQAEESDEEENPAEKFASTIIQLAHKNYDAKNPAISAALEKNKKALIEISKLAPGIAANDYWFQLNTVFAILSRSYLNVENLATQLLGRDLGLSPTQQTQAKQHPAIQQLFADIVIVISDAIKKNSRDVEEYNSFQSPIITPQRTSVTKPKPTQPPIVTAQRTSEAKSKPVQTNKKETELEKLAKQRINDVILALLDDTYVNGELPTAAADPRVQPPQIILAESYRQPIRKDLQEALQLLIPFLLPDVARALGKEDVDHYQLNNDIKASLALEVTNVVENRQNPQLDKDFYSKIKTLLDKNAAAIALEKAAFDRKAISIVDELLERTAGPSKLRAFNDVLRANRAGLIELVQLFQDLTADKLALSLTNIFIPPRANNNNVDAIKHDFIERLNVHTMSNVDQNARSTNTPAITELMTGLAYVSAKQMVTVALNDTIAFIKERKLLPREVEQKTDELKIDETYTKFPADVDSAFSHLDKDALAHQVMQTPYTETPDVIVPDQQVNRRKPKPSAAQPARQEKSPYQDKATLTNALLRLYDARPAMISYAEDALKLNVEGDFTQFTAKVQAFKNNNQNAIAAERDKEAKAIEEKRENEAKALIDERDREINERERVLTGHAKAMAEQAIHHAIGLIAYDMRLPSREGGKIVSYDRNNFTEQLTAAFEKLKVPLIDKLKNYLKHDDPSMPFEDASDLARILIDLYNGKRTAISFPDGAIDEFRNKINQMVEYNATAIFSSAFENAVKTLARDRTYPSGDPITTQVVDQYDTATFRTDLLHAFGIVKDEIIDIALSVATLRADPEISEQKQDGSTPTYDSFTLENPDYLLNVSSLYQSDPAKIRLAARTLGVSTAKTEEFVGAIVQIKKYNDDKINEAADLLVDRLTQKYLFLKIPLNNNRQGLIDLIKLIPDITKLDAAFDKIFQDHLEDRDNSPNELLSVLLSARPDAIAKFQTAVPLDLDQKAEDDSTQAPVRTLVKDISSVIYKLLNDATFREAFLEDDLEYDRGSEEKISPKQRQAAQRLVDAAIKEVTLENHSNVQGYFPFAASEAGEYQIVINANYKRRFHQDLDVLFKLIREDLIKHVAVNPESASKEGIKEFLHAALRRAANPGLTFSVDVVAQSTTYTIPDDTLSKFVSATQDILNGNAAVLVSQLIRLFNPPLKTELEQNKQGLIEIALLFPRLTVEQFRAGLLSMFNPYRSENDKSDTLRRNLFAQLNNITGSNIPLDTGAKYDDVRDLAVALADFNHEQLELLTKAKIKDAIQETVLDLVGQRRLPNEEKMLGEHISAAYTPDQFHALLTSAFDSLNQDDLLFNAAIKTQEQAGSPYHTKDSLKQQLLRLYNSNPDVIDTEADEQKDHLGLDTRNGNFVMFRDAITKTVKTENAEAIITELSPDLPIYNVLLAHKDGLIALINVSQLMTAAKLNHAFQVLFNPYDSRNNDPTALRNHLVGILNLPGVVPADLDIVRINLLMNDLALANAAKLAKIHEAHIDSVIDRVVLTLSTVQAGQVRAFLPRTVINRQETITPEYVTLNQNIESAFAVIRKKLKERALDVKHKEEKAVPLGAIDAAEEKAYRQAYSPAEFENNLLALYRDNPANLENHLRELKIEDPERTNFLRWITDTIPRNNATEIANALINQLKTAYPSLIGIIDTDVNRQRLTLLATLVPKLNDLRAAFDNLFGDGDADLRYANNANQLLARLLANAPLNITLADFTAWKHRLDIQALVTELAPVHKAELTRKFFAQMPAGNIHNILQNQQPALAELIQLSPQLLLDTLKQAFADGAIVIEDNSNEANLIAYLKRTLNIADADAPQLNVPPIAGLIHALGNYIKGERDRYIEDTTKGMAEVAIRKTVRDLGLQQNLPDTNDAPGEKIFYSDAAFTNDLLAAFNTIRPVIEENLKRHREEKESPYHNRVGHHDTADLVAELKNFFNNIPSPNLDIPAAAAQDFINAIEQLKKNNATVIANELINQWEDDFPHLGPTLRVNMPCIIEIAKLYPNLNQLDVVFRGFFDPLIANNREYGEILGALVAPGALRKLYDADRNLAAKLVDLTNGIAQANQAQRLILKAPYDLEVDNRVKAIIDDVIANKHYLFDHPYGDKVSSLYDTEILRIHLEAVYSPAVITEVMEHYFHQQEEEKAVNIPAYETAAAISAALTDLYNSSPANIDAAANRLGLTPPAHQSVKDAIVRIKDYNAERLAALLIAKLKADYPYLQATLDIANNKLGLIDLAQLIPNYNTLKTAFDGIFANLSYANNDAANLQQLFKQNLQASGADLNLADVPAGEITVNLRGLLNQLAVANATEIHTRSDAKVDKALDDVITTLSNRVVPKPRPLLPCTVRGADEMIVPEYKTFKNDVKGTFNIIRAQLKELAFAAEEKDPYSQAVLTNNLLALYKDHPYNLEDHLNELGIVDRAVGAVDHPDRTDFITGIRDTIPTRNATALVDALLDGPNGLKNTYPFLQAALNNPASRLGLIDLAILTPNIASFRTAFANIFAGANLRYENNNFDRLTEALLETELHFTHDVGLDIILRDADGARNIITLLTQLTEANKAELKLRCDHRTTQDIQQVIADIVTHGFLPLNLAGPAIPIAPEYKANFQKDIINAAFTPAFCDALRAKAFELEEQGLYSAANFQDALMELYISNAAELKNRLNALHIEDPIAANFIIAITVTIPNNNAVTIVDAALLKLEARDGANQDTDPQHIDVRHAFSVNCHVIAQQAINQNIRTALINTAILNRGLTSDQIATTINGVLDLSVVDPADANRKKYLDSANARDNIINDLRMTLGAAADVDALATKILALNQSAKPGDYFEKVIEDLHAELERAPDSHQYRYQLNELVAYFLGTPEGVKGLVELFNSPCIQQAVGEAAQKAALLALLKTLLIPPIRAEALNPPGNPDRLAEENRYTNSVKAKINARQAALVTNDDLYGHLPRLNEAVRDIAKQERERIVHTAGVLGPGRLGKTYNLDEMEPLINANYVRVQKARTNKSERDHALEAKRIWKDYYRELAQLRPVLTQLRIDLIKQHRLNATRLGRDPRRLFNTNLTRDINRTTQLLTKLEDIERFIALLERDPMMQSGLDPAEGVRAKVVKEGADITQFLQENGLVETPGGYQQIPLPAVIPGSSLTAPIKPGQVRWNVYTDPVRPVGQPVLQAVFSEQFDTVTRQPISVLHWDSQRDLLALLTQAASGYLQYLPRPITPAETAEFFAGYLKELADNRGTARGIITAETLARYLESPPPEMMVNKTKGNFGRFNTPERVAKNIVNQYLANTQESFYLYNFPSFELIKIAKAAISTYCANTGKTTTVGEEISCDPQYRRAFALVASVMGKTLPGEFKTGFKELSLFVDYCNYKASGPFFTKDIINNKYLSESRLTNATITTVRRIMGQ